MRPDALQPTSREIVLLQEAQAVRGRHGDVIRGRDVRLAVELRCDEPLPDHCAADADRATTIDVDAELVRVAGVKLRELPDAIRVLLALQHEVAAGRPEGVSFLHTDDRRLTKGPRLDGSRIVVLQDLHRIEHPVDGLKIETIFDSVCHYRV